MPLKDVREEVGDGNSRGEDAAVVFVVSQDIIARAVPNANLEFYLVQFQANKTGIVRLLRVPSHAQPE